MYLILRWVINALALLMVAYIIPGVHMASFYVALLAALILGIINAIIRPIMLLLTLPMNILTLGLFTLIVNALMFWLAGSVVAGFSVDGFWPAFWASLVFWAVTMATNGLLDNENDN